MRRHTLLSLCPMLPLALADIAQLILRGIHILLGIVHDLSVGEKGRVIDFDNRGIGGDVEKLGDLFIGKHRHRLMKGDVDRKALAFYILEFA